MSKKLYFGGLPYAVDDARLEELAGQFGELLSVKVILDKFTGQSKGFGFVEFSSEADADKAIETLNGSDLEGRSLTVNEAKPMTPRSGGGDRPRGKGGRSNFNSRW